MKTIVSKPIYKEEVKHRILKRNENIGEQWKARDLEGLLEKGYTLTWFGRENKKQMAFSIFIHIFLMIIQNSI